MRTILLAMAISATAMAGDLVRPNSSEPGRTVPQTTATAAKPAKRRSPFHYFKRLGQAEVNLAMRVSAWGIPEPDAKRISEPRGK